ncbi:hypothetical protein Aduo_007029 [Ancylostoma duodenale]
MISIIHPTRDTLEFAYRQPPTSRFANANLTRPRSLQMRPSKLSGGIGYVITSGDACRGISLNKERAIAATWDN